MVAARNSINTRSIELCRYYELGQILWILLNNQKQKTWIGAIYGHQEDTTLNNYIKLL